MKNILKVTILFCIIITCFIVQSFAIDVPGFVTLEAHSTHSFVINYEVKSNGNPFTSYYLFENLGDNDIYICVAETVFNRQTYVNPCVIGTTLNFKYARSETDIPINANLNGSTLGSLFTANDDTPIYYARCGTGWSTNTYNYISASSSAYYGDPLDACKYVRDYINNPPPLYSKNPNVDEFIANTLISMGIHYNQYSDALSIATSAWDYIIDENNWYIGTGDRNDKDIKWSIDTAVSYANAQSNNYKDWYNGYKVNKDLTIALTKFISDNYIASTLGSGTLAGYGVSYNSSYSYGNTSGTSGFGGTFGSTPNANSFYPASTITYFNGAYLHDNDFIDQDEFVYTPADVRKFIGYPSTSGIIEPPDDTPASGTITDGNGDTVYNIDLEFPSLDWLANAIQSLLDFLDRLITTIADFLTQILDAILSLFSDAFESLTAFGQGLIEWLYSVVGSFSTLGSNYIPSSLWAVLLPFIFLNIGVGLILFVLRSH